MRTLSALAIGCAIFTINGKRVVIAGFRGDVFVVFPATEVQGFWYQDFAETIKVPAVTVTDMIERADFTVVGRMSAAPTPDEIDAWFQSPSSLGIRYPIVDAYCRERHDCTTRDQWIGKRRQIARQIRAALRNPAA